MANIWYASLPLLHRKGHQDSWQWGEYISLEIPSPLLSLCTRIIGPASDKDLTAGGWDVQHGYNLPADEQHASGGCM